MKLSADQKAMLVILLEDGPQRYEEARTTFSSLIRKGFAEQRTEPAPGQALPYNRMMHLTDNGREAAQRVKTVSVMEHVALIRSAMQRRIEAR